MSNIAATYRYRREMAQAISLYREAQREIFERYGRPVPLSQDCGAAMAEAWGACRVALAKADIRLESDRDIAGEGMKSPYAMTDSELSVEVERMIERMSEIGTEQSRRAAIIDPPRFMSINGVDVC